MEFLPNITAKIARENYDHFHHTLQNNKFTMYKEWLEKIQERSSMGETFTLTSKFYLNHNSQAISFVSSVNEVRELAETDLKEIVAFFEARGFKMELRHIADNAWYYIISW